MNEKFKRFLVIVTLLTINCFNSCDSLMFEVPRFYNQTDRQILHHLLDSSKYDLHMRPDEPTHVNVSVIILTLFSPDESSLKYEVEFLLNQVWNDPRLMYDDGMQTSSSSSSPSSSHDQSADVSDTSVTNNLDIHTRERNISRRHLRHPYLNALPHREAMWMPDTYFILHGEFKYPTDPMHMALKIYPNGTVLYTSRRNMIITCEGNLRIFPFDSPKCFFAIESMSHEENQLQLKWFPTDSSPIMFSGSMRSLNAYLIKNATGNCGIRHSWRSDFSCLSVYLVFTRDKSFYLSTVFVPGMVLVTSSFISFWLDVNAVPARVMIGVTTMLNFCTTTNSFRSGLPVVSNLTAMNLWDFVCMFFIYASMLEFIIVNYLYRKANHSSRPQSSGGGGGGAGGGAISGSVTTGPTGVSDHHSHHHLHRPSSDLRTSGKEELDVRVPLVTQANISSDDQRLNHRSTAVTGTGSGGTTGEPVVSGLTLSASAIPVSSTSRPSSTGIHMDDRARAAASVFAWLRRPNIFPPEREITSQAKLARSIDHVSKTVFPFLYGVFAFAFFTIFAGYLPSLLDEWIANEYREE